MELKEFLKIAANVKPDHTQLERLRETPFYAFVHFSPNTYTNLGNLKYHIFGLFNRDN